MRINLIKQSLRRFGSACNSILFSVFSKRYNVDAVELCLLHERKDPLKGAYDRTKHISERRRIMEDWGNYCTSLISDKFWGK